MESLRINSEQQLIVNQNRVEFAKHMQNAGSKDASFIVIWGACSPDMNYMPDGRLAAVVHGEEIYEESTNIPGVVMAVRFVSDKPRTNIGQTGIFHEPGGPEAYVNGARELTDQKIPLASEVMSDVSAAIAKPYLTFAWDGSREAAATGPRYQLRHSSIERDYGVPPVAALIKTTRDGDMDDTVNAITTVLSDKPRSRAVLAPDGGLVTAYTYANPNIGVILRGRNERPEGNVDEVLEQELFEVTERLDYEFGSDIVIPKIIDTSHAHANHEGGGETGQLIVSRAAGRLIRRGVQIDGIMSETYIHPGKQPETETVPGLSITDACIRQELAKSVLGELGVAWASRERELVQV